jgi:hypothetical protein
MLGLKRTDDIAEIRRAYARKLKATDVDADPAAFIALRAAFEHAIGDAEASRRRAAAAASGEAPPHDIAIAAFPADEDPPMAAEAAAHRAAAAEPVAAGPEAGAGAGAREDPNARYALLQNLLFPDEGAAPADPDALASAVRAILDHPDMEQVDRRGEVETWLAEMLCHAVPRSDPVIPMAVEHFHWDRKAGHWDQPWMFDELVKRRNAFRLLDQLAYRGHPLHAAWRDLTSDKETIGLRPFGRRSDVKSLLYKIRAEAPVAEAYLNPHRVALWEGYTTNTGGGGTGLNWVWMAVVVIMALGRLASAINAPNPPSLSTSPSVVGGYADPNVDIDPFVQAASQNSLHFADLDRRNPALHDRLLDRWNQASNRHDMRDQFSDDVRSILDQAVGEGLRGGSYALQAAYWRLRADELRWLRGADVESCARSIRGDTLNLTLPVEFSDRLRAIEARALGEAARNPPPALPPGTNSRYRIPGPVVEDTMRRSGLSESVLHQAFLDRGTSAQLCAARIALLEAALALPERRGAPLLRDMSRVL